MYSLEPGGGVIVCACMGQEGKEINKIPAVCTEQAGDLCPVLSMETFDVRL